MREDGFQESALEYPELSGAEIFEAVERFFRSYYLRPDRICASSDHAGGSHGVRPSLSGGL